MKCKNECGNDLTGRQKEYCSDKCRMQAKRNPNKVEQPEPEQAKVEQAARESLVSLSPTIDQPDISTLPDGVSKPTGQRTAKTQAMSTGQLSAAIRAYRGLTWLDSLEYAEVTYRLQTRTIEELEEVGQFVPAWKRAA